MSGKVYLVGAGPGSPDGLTLWAIQCLQQADLVLYDYLVSPALLVHAPESAERVCLGHHGHGRVVSQEEIDDRMIEAAKAGKTVVRLKGGDPGVFGHTFEEVEALRAAGVDFQIVPGVTAAAAAAAAAGIALTDTDRASAVVLVTGHERSGKSGLALDYDALARFPGTLVFYMGVRTVGTWSRRLVEHGKSPDTPVAIVHRAGGPGQRVLRTNLGELADVVAREDVHPPSVFVVGEVARNAKASRG